MTMTMTMTMTMMMMMIIIIIIIMVSKGLGQNDDNCLLTVTGRTDPRTIYRNGDTHHGRPILLSSSFSLFVGPRPLWRDDQGHEIDILKSPLSTKSPLDLQLTIQKRCDVGAVVRAAARFSRCHQGSRCSSGWMWPFSPKELNVWLLFF